MTSKQRDTSAQTENGAAETEAYQPIGLELRGNLSFARLNPHAGENVRKTGDPQLCGWITGMAYAHLTESKNSQYGDYTRLIGEFFAVPFDQSSEITGTEIFLPGIAERFVVAAIDKAGQCPIRFEGWCFPDTSGRKGGTGYVYRIFVRQPPGAMSIARKMAIEAGIIAAPPAPPPLQIGNYDLETGELLPEGAMAEPAERRDGLAELLGEPEAIAAE